jgi:hypothetical protein
MKTQRMIFLVAPRYHANDGACTGVKLCSPFKLWSHASAGLNMVSLLLFAWRQEGRVKYLPGRRAGSFSNLVRVCRPCPLSACVSISLRVASMRVIALVESAWFVLNMSATWSPISNSALSAYIIRPPQLFLCLMNDECLATHV